MTKKGLKDDGPGDEGDEWAFGQDERPYDEKVSVKQLLSEIEGASSHLREFHQRAMMNERFILGAQTWDHVSDSKVAFQWGRRTPSRNYLRHLANTYSSRILEDYPSVTAYPADGSAVDHGAAEVCNDILDYVYERNDLDAMFARAALLAQAHSCVAFTVAWDKGGGQNLRIPQVDEESGLPLFQFNEETGEREPVVSEEPAGDVRIGIKTIFDFVTDGSELIEDSEYVGFRRLIDRHRATRMVAKKFPEEMKVGLLPDAEVQSVWGEKANGVEAWEIYWRPGPDSRFPGGLYATVVGGYVLENRAFTYDHGELPIAIWKVGDRRDHPYGSTHIDDAVEIQGIINAKVELQLKMYETWLKSMKLAANRQVADAWSDENEVVVVDDPAVLQYIRWLDPPMSAVAKYTEDIDAEVRRLYDIFGLEPTGPKAASTSGRAMAYRKETEGAKLAPAHRNLSACVKRIMRQSLKLYQQFAEMRRTVAMTGPDGTFRTRAFANADISGWDVRLQNTSGLNRFRDVKVDEQRNLAMASGKDPSMVDESGLDGERTDMFDARAVQEQINTLLEGQPVMPDQTINPAVGVREVTMALEELGHMVPPNVMQSMQMLLMEYRMRMAGGQGGQGAGLSSRGASLDQQDPTKTTAGMPRGVQGGGLPQ